MRKLTHPPFTTRKSIVAVLALCCFIAPARSQEWARKMFQTTSHSFGNVARGAKAEFAFKLTNIYKEDIHIAGVRSSCGCTTPKISQQTLKTYEQGEIIAQFNTRTFLGEKSATLTVTIDRPFYAEIQLQVSGYIRSDVVLDPGAVDFGAVDHGSPAERTLRVTYAGRHDWQIKDVLSASDYLEAELKELSRGNGQVVYNLTVRMKDNVPVGYVKDQITLLTNDVRASQIPVDIEGRVVSEITVSPASLFLGVVQPGQKRTKQIVVKGKKPFRIVDVKCDDAAFEFSMPDTAKSTHLVTVTFTAGNSPEKVSQRIRITTDLGGGLTPEVPAYAEVVSAGL